MTADDALAIAVGLVVGAVGVWIWLPAAIDRVPVRLVRNNIEGRLVPAVLGLPLGMGALNAMFVAHALGLGDLTATARVRLGLALLVVIVGSGLAGLADDLRGDEADRGFAGHLRAALSGRITGGIVKILGIGAAALVGGVLVGDGWFLLETVLLVGLGANLVNLVDRAPGRAAKLCLAGAAALTAFGLPQWAGLSAGLWGGLAVAAHADLKQRAMLGDAGSNALGAALGFGLALSLEPAGRVVAIVLLAVLNVASERWSFSQIIERASWLRAIDRIGR